MAVSLRRPDDWLTCGERRSAAIQKNSDAKERHVADCTLEGAGLCHAYRRLGRLLWFEPSIHSH